MAKPARIHEDHGRSLIKTITYRVLILVSSFLIVYSFTGQAEASTRITLMVNISATLIYYLHERIWNGIHWGRRHK